jgi:hypothetical protein
MNRRRIALGAWAGGVVLAGCGAVSGEPISLRSDARSTLGDGLIGYWKLDESAADQPVLDSSGFGHDGEPFNGPALSSLVAPVKIRDTASRAFDGVDQYIDLGNPTALSFAGPITIAAWVYAASIPDRCQTVISHGFRLNPSGEVALRAAHGSCDTMGQPATWAVGAFDGVNHFAETPVLPEEIGAWVHLTGTFDGQAWRLYRNGAEAVKRADTVGPFPIDASWGIGGRVPNNPATDPRVLNGRVDEVRLYNRALSPSEILDLYNL